MSRRLLPVRARWVVPQITYGVVVSVGSPCSREPMDNGTLGPTTIRGCSTAGNVAPMPWVAPSVCATWRCRGESTPSAITIVDVSCTCADNAWTNVPRRRDDPICVTCGSRTTTSGSMSASSVMAASSIPRPSTHTARPARRAACTAAIVWWGLCRRSCGRTDTAEDPAESSRVAATVEKRSTVTSSGRSEQSASGRSSRATARRMVSTTFSRPICRAAWTRAWGCAIAVPGGPLTCTATPAAAPSERRWTGESRGVRSSDHVIRWSSSSGICSRRASSTVTPTTGPRRAPGSTDTAVIACSAPSCTIRPPYTFHGNHITR